ncbi:MAG: hypothetical protein RXO36_07190 [Candidatus Nanopusillus acidilobi]
MIRYIELNFNQYSPKVVKPFINLYHINLYRYYWNGHEPVYEPNTIRKGFLFK